MRYVCAMPQGEHPDLQSQARLYAYPRPPEPPVPDGFVLMDSGAFGLSKSGRTMDAAHIAGLRRHYAQYGGERIYGIAPDVYLNPALSLRNFREWHEGEGAPAIIPVVQFSRQRAIDGMLVWSQVEAYANYALPTYLGRRMICISNPGCTAVQSRPLASVIRLIRQRFADLWIHYLGAGWSPADVRAYAHLGVFDSIDSIAYYTDAQNHVAWSMLDTRSSDQPVAALIAQNARIAAQIAATGSTDDLPSARHS